MTLKNLFLPSTGTISFSSNFDLQLVEYKAIESNDTECWLHSSFLVVIDSWMYIYIHTFLRLSFKCIHIFFQHLWIFIVHLTKPHKDIFIQVYKALQAFSSHLYTLICPTSLILLCSKTILPLHLCQIQTLYTCFSLLCDKALLMLLHRSANCWGDRCVLPCSDLPWKCNLNFSNQYWCWIFCHTFVHQLNFIFWELLILKTNLKVDMISFLIFLLFFQYYSSSNLQSFFLLLSMYFHSNFLLCCSSAFNFHGVIHCWPYFLKN